MVLFRRLDGLKLAATGVTKVKTGVRKAQSLQVRFEKGAEERRRRQEMRVKQQIRIERERASLERQRAALRRLREANRPKPLSLGRL